MTDEHESAFTDELATSLHAAAALTPRTADPYGPLGPAIARDRRRRTTIAASLAVVAVLGAAAGIGGAVGHGGPASGQSAPAAAGTPTTAAPSTATKNHESLTTPPATDSSPPRVSTTDPLPMMLGWPSDYSLDPGYQTSKSQAEPTVEAMIHTYGKQVDDGTRNVLDELVGSFQLCGYPLTSYTFTLRWAGDLPHLGSDGAAVVDIAHAGTTYRMAGYGSAKGVWLQLPTAITADQATRVETVPLPKIDSSTQEFYVAVVAAPGSKVTISGIERHDLDHTTTSFQTDTVTVGASGAVEVKLTSRGARGDIPYPTIASVRIVRPDGTVGPAPLVGGDNTVQEQSARQLLPATTTCPGIRPETPQS